MSPHPRPAPDTLAALHSALTRTVRGTVDFSPGARALTTMDASNYRRVPLGVVAPYDSDDVAATLAACREHGVPLVPRGGGTSIAGQATGTGIVLDFTRHMNRLLDLDPETRTARVQPGLVLDTLRAAAVPYGLTFGPDPSTHARCTLGGMIGNNSCGAHSVAWGTTADNTETLDVLAADGTPHHLARGWNTAASASHGRTPPGPARTPSGPAGTPPSPTPSAPSSTPTSPSSAPATPRSRAASRDTRSTPSSPSTAPTSPARGAAARAPSGCSPRRAYGSSKRPRRAPSPSSATRTRARPPRPPPVSSPSPRS
ncbi:FAD binding domain-containing protein, partial [Streptomyces sp. SolWspMP-sol7th]